MEQLKIKYNETLKRCFKAMDYLDDPSTPQKEREKWLPEFKKLLHNQQFLMKKLGLKSGDKEVLEGFKDV